MHTVEPPLRVTKRMSVQETRSVVAWPSVHRRTTNMRMNRLSFVLTWAARVSMAFLSLSQIAPLAYGQGGCPAPTSAAKISPVAATVLPSGTVQFRTIGVSDPIVWSVNDNAGGSPDLGTISADGLYTAPRNPTVAGVTVSIVSSKDKVAIDSAQVLIGKQAISLAPLAATHAAITPGSRPSLTFGTISNSCAIGGRPRSTLRVRAVRGGRRDDRARTPRPPH